jgi:Tol biopolymer transport system component
VDSAKWSPDGEHVAFVGMNAPTGSDWDIYVIHPDGSGKQNLTSTLINKEANYPMWSPDGLKLVFTVRDGTVYNDLNYDLYRILIDGTGLIQLTTNLKADRFPFWIP